MNTHYLTLGQAAIHLKCSKATISKALKSGSLSGTKQEDGSFRIDPAELSRWDGERSTRNAGNQSQTPSETPANGHAQPLALLVEVAELRTRLASVESERERERETLSGTIEDLRNRLDAESSERRKLSERLLAAPVPERAAISPQEAPQGGGWLSGLLGRRNA